MVIRSKICRFYKSNVARLRPWRRREPSEEGGAPALKVLELEVVKLPEPVRKEPKRGRGRPKGSVNKKKPPLGIIKVVPGADKVSPVAGRKGNKTLVVTKPVSIKKLPEAGLREKPTVVRRSSRMKQRAAVA